MTSRSPTTRQRIAGRTRPPESTGATSWAVPDAAPRRLTGNAMAITVFAAVFGSGLLVGGPAWFRGAPTVAPEELILRGQAAQYARVGLTEAANWFRRQPVHPVHRFAPSTAESEDPGIGLVHEFEVGAGIWGRYEVWRPDRADARPQRERLAVRDISAARGFPADSGKVLRLRCVAWVYRREDERRRYDVAPNQVLGSAVLETEITRLELRLPGQAALCARRGDAVQVGARGQVGGGPSAVGIYYPAGTGAPHIDAGGVGGVAPTAAAAPHVYDDSALRVFGATTAELVTMSDENPTNPDFFPTALRRNSLTCVRCPELAFTQSRPLRGRGILHVEGNLTFNPGSDSRFEGLIYVDGDLTVRGPAQLRGAVVVTGKVLIQGSGGDATLTYDDEVLRALRDAVGMYRVSSSVRRLDGDRAVSD